MTVPIQLQCLPRRKRSTLQRAMPFVTLLVLAVMGLATFNAMAADVAHPSIKLGAHRSSPH